MQQKMQSAPASKITINVKMYSLYIKSYICTNVNRTDTDGREEEDKEERGALNFMIL